MQQVHKFTLEFTADLQSVELPTDAAPLRFAMQGNRPQLWALVDVGADHVKRFFRIISTGKPVPDVAHYVGSCDDQEFVWHLFETAAPQPATEKAAPTLETAVA